jgi:hypothetical protein
MVQLTQLMQLTQLQAQRSVSGDKQTRRKDLVRVHKKPYCCCAVVGLTWNLLQHELGYCRKVVVWQKVVTARHRLLEVRPTKCKKAAT